MGKPVVAGQAKDIQLIGSGELVQTLIAEDLIDEYLLMIHPIVMGIGKRLFRDERATARPEPSRQSSSGFGTDAERLSPRATSRRRSVALRWCG